MTSKLASCHSATSWRQVKLGEVVVQIAKGESPAWQGFDYQTHGVRFIRSENVLFGSYKEAPNTFIPEAFHRKIGRSAIRPGDVLVNLVGASIGRACLAPNSLGEANVNQAVAVITPNCELDAQFLLGIMLSPTTQDYIRSARVEMARANISLEDLRQLPISLPPLEIQKQIAACLHAQMNVAKEVRASLKLQLNHIDSLQLALLRESLNSNETNLLPIISCLSEVTEGIGDRWHEFPVLGATRSGLAPAKEGVGKTPGRYKPVRVETVFYNPMRILLGSIAIIDEGDAPGITSPDYVAMTAVEGILHPLWFYHWFRSPGGAEFIKSLTRGAVRERLLFNRLAKGTIPVPPFTAQVACVAKLREIKRTRQLIEKRLAEVEKLPVAFLRATFGRAA